MCYERLLQLAIKTMIEKYTDALKPSNEAKNQMKIDLMAVINSAKTSIDYPFEETINYAIQFVCNFTEDEMVGMSIISKYLNVYSLKILKGLYLYNNQEVFSVSKFFSSDSKKKVVVKKEKLQKLFELAQNNIVALIESGEMGVDVNHSSGNVFDILNGVNQLVKMKAEAQKRARLASGEEGNA